MVYVVVVVERVDSERLFLLDTVDTVDIKPVCYDVRGTRLN
jgi:hypothetical protein